MNLKRKDILNLIKEKYPEEIDYNLVREYINLHSYECPEHLQIYNKHESYQNLFYLYCATVCYFDYSKGAVRFLEINKDKLPGINRILDLGAGNGLTSMHLSEAFNCTVYYNQLDGIQKIFAKELFMRYKPNCVILPEDKNFIKTRGDIDLVFASDFFEHLEYPVNFLENVIKRTNPKYITTCNAFTAPHPDHIQKYKYQEDNESYIEIEPKQMSRFFSKKMRDNGYEVYLSGWHCRPYIWRKE